MNREVLVRYHEVGLKGQNKPYFLDCLVANLRRATRGTGVQGVWQRQSQIGLVLSPGASPAAVQREVQRVFGVVKTAAAWRSSAELEEIKRTVIAALEESRRSFSSFRITANRADKSYPLTSLEVSRELGTFVRERTGTRVDLTRPELTVYVDILSSKTAFVYLDPVVGPGGLPVGTGGRVMALLSGGIDSPVAAYRMMKRGCQVDLVHFHSFPLADGSSREKAVELGELLNRYQFHTCLYLVPFAEVQRHIIATAPPPYRVVLYRRFMMRIAEELARRRAAKALVTGESLGQVASQTLENVVTIDAVVEMPVLRPLIGMDKAEIVSQAEAIGTYPVSILPDQDCCSLFVPQHPVTRCTPERAERVEQGLAVEELLRAAADAAEIRNIDEAEVQVGGR